ncbi:MAG: zinc-ribbon domain and TM2 domain-containing protein [Halobacteriota archaeon]|jgi:TM2 domain-containing membrane protein YozV
MANTFCRLCGAKLIADSKFCANCGQPIYEAPTTIQETDYVDLRPQSAAQPVYQEQEYYPEEYKPSQAATAQSSALGPEAYPPAAAAPFSATPTPQQAPVPVYMADRKNPGVAAVLSFFWAGLGQIYNGQLAKGIGFIVLYAFCVLLIFAVIGFILVPIVWIIGIWDAYNTAKQYNEKQQQNERLYYNNLRR